MAVAKSYQNLPIFGEPFTENGKQYVAVVKPNGSHKKVRWYTEKEYDKLYPEDTERSWKKLRSVQDVLGFKNGYITIFKGDTYSLLEWFRAEPACRYHSFWGWYVTSEEEVPQPLPAGIETVQLKWDDVSIAGEDTLKSEALVRAAVEALLYEPSKSTHQGSVGERLDLILAVSKAIKLEDGYYGPKMFYLFTDENGNEFTWNTTPRELEIGKWYTVRGTVKAHNIYKGSPQTELTRCSIK